MKEPNFKKLIWKKKKSMVKMEAVKMWLHLGKGSCTYALFESWLLHTSACELSIVFSSLSELRFLAQLGKQ